MSFISYIIISETVLNFSKLAVTNAHQMQIPTRPTHQKTHANLYPPKRQLTKASEPFQFDLEGGVQGQIRPHQKIPTP